MKSNTTHLTDIELINWLDNQIELRNELNKACSDIAFDEQASETILIYALVDIRRIGKILNLPVVISENTVSSGYKAELMYKDYVIHTYPKLSEIVRGK